VRFINGFFINIFCYVWIFQYKKKYNGCFERYMACLVGDDGRSEMTKVDYDETSSHIVKPTIIMYIISIVLSKSWFILYLYAKSVFLHSQLNETIYKEQIMQVLHLTNDKSTKLTNHFI